MIWDWIPWSINIIQCVSRYIDNRQEFKIWKKFIWKSFKAPIISMKANHRTFFKLVPSLTKVQHSLAFIRVPNHSQNDLDFRSFLLITHCPTVHDVKVNKTSETRTSFGCLCFSRKSFVALSRRRSREKFGGRQSAHSPHRMQFTFSTFAFSSWENHWLKRTFAVVRCFSFCCNSVRWGRDRRVTHSSPV